MWNLHVKKVMGVLLRNSCSNWRNLENPGGLVGKSPPGRPAPGFCWIRKRVKGGISELGLGLGGLARPGQPGELNGGSRENITLHNDEHVLGRGRG